MLDFIGSSISFISGDGSSPEPVHTLLDLNVGSESAFLLPPDGNSERFRFGRMFRSPNLPEFRPDLAGLIDLGLDMTKPMDTKDHPELPAGYTYFGQFVDHDITFDKTKGFPAGNLSVEDVEQGRSPTLDLDSLYGLGPAGELKHPDGRRIYQPDGVKLRLDITDPDHSLKFSGNFENDLPRGDFGYQVEKASVADDRNDENLVVAQTHLAFIKFHNNIVDLIRTANPNLGDAVFDKAREEVVRYYQWIILEDFLPRIVDPDVLRGVRESGGRHFSPTQVNQFMPFEFSFAAFRFGHSLIRETYEWNKFFHATPPANGIGGVADLSELLRRTGFKHNILGGGHRHLPGTWIINWANFYDFGGLPGHAKNLRLNFAKLIDTSLASPLGQLRIPVQMPAAMSEAIARRGLQPGVVSLPMLNLLRGWLVGVPSAQSVIERLNEKLPAGEKIVPLTHDEIALDHGNSLRPHGLHILTPLWYYILREAKLRHRGERLGPVGSHIVSEAFVGLIKSSKTSILHKDDPTEPDWTPDLGLLKKAPFAMTDLLILNNDINPLGN